MKLFLCRTELVSRVEMNRRGEEGRKSSRRGHARVVFNLPKLFHVFVATYSRYAATPMTTSTAPMSRYFPFRLIFLMGKKGIIVPPARAQLESRFSSELSRARGKSHVHAQPPGVPSARAGPLMSPKKRRNIPRPRMRFLPYNKTLSWARALQRQSSTFSLQVGKDMGPALRVWRHRQRPGNSRSINSPFIPREAHY